MAFKPVAFVSVSQLQSDNTPQEIHKPTVSLVGKEISKFYQKLIADPSDSVVNNKKRQVLNQHCKRKNLRVRTKQKETLLPKTEANYKRNDIFRHAQEGNVQEVARLLNSGCDINSKDLYGWTPLMCASCSGSLSVVEYLLKHNADVNISDKQGRKALDLAEQQGHTRVMYLLQGNFKSSRLPSAPCESIKTCNLCSISYKETKLKHESSIIHQLNTGHKKRDTFYHIPENNIGFQLMLKEGWNKNEGLGPQGLGQKFPVKTILKQDRKCLGNKTEAKPRITHFNSFDTTAVERIQPYKAPVFRLGTLKKRKRQEQERRNKQIEINFRREFN